MRGDAATAATTGTATVGVVLVSVTVYVRPPARTTLSLMTDWLAPLVLMEPSVTVPFPSPPKVVSEVDPEASTPRVSMAMSRGAGAE